jgi:hypothetical protein
MAAAPKVPCFIRITPEVKARVDRDTYHCIDGGDEENILCALLVFLGTENVWMTAKQFLDVYIEFAQILHDGICIDFGVHPQLAGTKLFVDARGMAQRKVPNLLERKTILTVARFISGNDAMFEKSLSSEITLWEARLLVSQFSPGVRWME